MGGTLLLWVYHGVDQKGSIPVAFWLAPRRAGSFVRLESCVYSTESLSFPWKRVKEKKKKYKSPGVKSHWGLVLHLEAPSTTSTIPCVSLRPSLASHPLPVLPLRWSPGSWMAGCCRLDRIHDPDTYAPGLVPTQISSTRPPGRDLGCCWPTPCARLVCPLVDRSRPGQPASPRTPLTPAAVPLGGRAKEVLVGYFWCRVVFLFPQGRAGVHSVNRFKASIPALGPIMDPHPDAPF